MLVEEIALLVLVEWSQVAVSLSCIRHLAKRVMNYLIAIL